MERRAEPRFHVGSKARMFLPEDSRELTAHVINVSGSGLRVLISENLALGQHIVLDLEHHLVAAEACNCEETGGKFAVGLRRLHEVSKLDGHGSADEQIRGLMTEMGWVPGPSLIESSKATEPTASEAPKTVDPEPAAIEVPVVVEPAAPAIELPVVVELAASATAAPQATEPEPPGIDSCEAAGLAPVAMELPKAAEPKPALIEWQVVELNAPAIEFPKAQEPQHAAIELPVVELNAPTIEPFKAPEPHDAATELAVLELAAPVIELPKPPEPQRAAIEFPVVEPDAPVVEIPKAPEPQHAAIELPVVQPVAGTGLATPDSAVAEPLSAPEPVQAPVAAQQGEPTAASATILALPPPIVVAAPAKKRWPIWAAAAAGLLALLAAAMMVTRTNADARAGVPPKVAEERPAPVPPASSAAVPSISNPAPASSAATPAVSPTPQPSPITPQQSAPAVVPATSNLHALTITAREPSWLEITIDGKTVFQKMVAAGETKQMEFSRVALLHIGNAAKVDVTLDSRPVARPAQTVPLRLLELTASGARDLPWRNGAPLLTNRPPGGAPQ